MIEAEQLGGPLAEHLATEIPRAARNRAKRFASVPYEDFEQVMWERVLAKTPMFRELLAAGKHGTIWLELLRAGTKLGYEDDRYRRAQKAANSGYSVLDEEFYDRGILRVLLPVLIEAEFDPALAVERATQGTDAAGVRIHSSDSEHAAENYMVMLIDVCKAFRRLPPYQRKLLTDYYGLDQSDTDKGRWERTSRASSMGLTLKAWQSRVYRALDDLEHELGGRNPWMRDQRDESAGKAA